MSIMKRTRHRSSSLRAEILVVSFVVTVVIQFVPGNLEVTAPYHPPLMRAMRGLPDRRWTPSGGVPRANTRARRFYRVAKKRKGFGKEPVSFRGEESWIKRQPGTAWIYGQHGGLNSC